MVKMGGQNHACLGSKPRSHAFHVHKRHTWPERYSGLGCSTSDGDGSRAFSRDHERPFGCLAGLLLRNVSATDKHAAGACHPQWPSVLFISYPPFSSPMTLTRCLILARSGLGDLRAEAACCGTSGRFERAERAGYLG